MSGFSNKSGQNLVSNVVTFGADPSGVVDSAAAIQAAINSVANGGQVWFPAGTYKVGTPLTMGNGSSIAAPLAASMNGTTPSGTFTLTINTANQVVFNGGAFKAGAGVLTWYTSSVSTVRINYTSYNSATGVFSGCTIAAGTAIPIVATGAYATSMIVTQGTVSSQHGIQLMGAGVPGSPYLGFLGYNQQAVKINYVGPAFSTCLTLQGLMNGWGIQNLYFDCSGSNPSTGISIQGASFGTMDQVSITGATIYGLQVTGIPGFYNPDSSATVIGASYGNQFNQVQIQQAADFGAFHILGALHLDGDTGGLGYPSANATFCNFENLTVSIGGVAAGNFSNAVVMAFCDDCTIRDLNVINGVTSGTARAVLYNYNNYPGGYAPFNCLIDDFYTGGAVIQQTGTPGAPIAQNKMNNPRGPIANPNLTGISWGNGGQQLPISITSGTAFQPCWWQNVEMKVPITGAVAGGSVTVSIGPTSSGLGTNVVGTLTYTASELLVLTYMVPAGWYSVVTATGATITGANASTA
jgi:hypothetical protein